MTSLPESLFSNPAWHALHTKHSHFGIAMGGERLRLDGYPEISGVCTHPAHRGKGYAASIIWELVRNHRRNGEVSWLHVGAANLHAIDLYCRMGFTVSRKVTFHRISWKR
jgi:predicted GNAT family acetyltransferase